MKRMIVTICLVVLSFSVCEAEASMLSDLWVQIHLVPDEVLSDQVRQSLVMKVENAMQLIDRDLDGIAVKQLQALIKQVEALSGNKIDPMLAEVLVYYVDEIIHRIELGVKLVEFTFTNDVGPVDGWPKYTEESLVCLELEIKNRNPEAVVIYFDSQVFRHDPPPIGYGWWWIGTAMPIVDDIEFAPGETKYFGASFQLPAGVEGLCMVRLTIFVYTEMGGELAVEQKEYFVVE